MVGVERFDLLSHIESKTLTILFLFAKLFFVFITDTLESFCREFFVDRVLNHLPNLFDRGT